MIDSDTQQVKTIFPSELLAELDKVWPKRYRSRHAAIMDAVRKLIDELKEASS